KGVVEAVAATSGLAPDPGLEAVASVAEARKALCQDVLSLRLGAAGLPEKAREAIAKKFAGRVF
ncbi:MAG: hypothetical protein HY783_04635, partial [Chloroflexi bacterium]|nr:hypothetical protein [Chloroflexota bacterium]